MTMHPICKNPKCKEPYAGNKTPPPKRCPSCSARNPYKQPLIESAGTGKNNCINTILLLPNVHDKFVLTDTSKFMPNLNLTEKEFKATNLRQIQKSNLSLNRGREMARIREINSLNTN